MRRISADEWLRLRDLRLEALQDSPTAFVSQYAEERMKSDAEWRSRALRSCGEHPQPDGGLVVTLALEHAGSDHWVGMATVFQEPGAAEPQAQVVGVCVQLAHRGRAAGAAEVLVRGALGWARGDGAAERVRLFVREDNRRAMAFYGRLGFVETGVAIPYPPDPSVSECEMDYRGV